MTSISMIVFKTIIFYFLVFGCATSQREVLGYNVEDDDDDDSHNKTTTTTISNSNNTNFNNKKTSSTKATKFGHEIYQNEFLLNYTNFNHGSFGACPKRVLEYQSSLRLQQEQQPDIWMRLRYLEIQNQTRQIVADYVNADSHDNIVLLESASTAVNSIFRSMKFHNGDKIVYFVTAYGMVKHTSAFVVDRLNELDIGIIEIPLLEPSFPIPDDVGNDAFLIPMKRTLDNLQQQGKLNSLKIVVLDHIISSPGIKMPVRELATMIKDYIPTTFILVDGAHALGQIRNLNIQELGPIDAYLSNGHKWLYSPKGSAFLWMNHSRITKYFPEPTVISSENQISVNGDDGNDDGTATMISLSERYKYTSTRDYTALLSFPAAIHFRQHTLGGDDAIYDYIRNLAIEARRYLLELWNVSALAPEYMEEFMINIELPIISSSTTTIHDDITDTDVGKELQEYLLEHHNMYIIVLRGIKYGSGLLYTRLSAQIYLELSDFHRLGQAVIEFVKTKQQQQRTYYLRDGQSEIG